MKVFFPVQALKGTIDPVKGTEIVKNILKKDAKIFPISDGGDGFVNVMHHIYPKGKLIKIKTINAEGKNIYTKVLKYKNNYYIESADIIGIKRINNNINPFQRHTAGIGIVLKKIYNNYDNFYIGLGGSSSVDIGGSMLEIMGNNVKYYKNTKIMKNIKINKKYNNIFLIPDVKNSLNGNNGAIIYAKQKSVTNINRLLKIYNKFSKLYNLENIKYLGAAGGLGAAFYLIGGNFINNFNFFNNLYNIKKNILKSDIIILCEGKFDKQTYCGKINGKIVNIAIKNNKKIFFITGKSEIKIPQIKIIKLNKNSLKKPNYYFKKALLQIKQYGNIY